MRCAYYGSCIPLTVASLAAVRNDCKAVHYESCVSFQSVGRTLQSIGNHWQGLYHYMLTTSPEVSFPLLVALEGSDTVGTALDA